MKRRNYVFVWFFALIFFSCSNTISDYKNQDLNLASLELSSGTIQPTFSPNTTNYTIKVSNNTSDLTITGIAENKTSFVSSPVSVQSLVAGNATNRYITVFGDNGDQKTYSFTIIRNLPGDIGAVSTQISNYTQSYITEEISKDVIIYFRVTNVYSDTVSGKVYFRIVTSDDNIIDDYTVFSNIQPNSYVDACFNINTLGKRCKNVSLIKTIKD